MCASIVRVRALAVGARLEYIRRGNGVCLPAQRETVPTVGADDSYRCACAVVSHEYFDRMQTWSESGRFHGEPQHGAFTSEQSR
jgi:hypothetical protein